MEETKIKLSNDDTMPNSSETTSTDLNRNYRQSVIKNLLKEKQDLEEQLKGASSSGSGNSKVDPEILKNYIAALDRLIVQKKVDMAMGH